MKKFFLSIVAALLAVPTFAQFTSGGFTISENNTYYGIRIGMAMSNFGGDYVDMNSKTGLTLGGVIGIRLSDSAPVFLESGLYYSGHGAKKDKEFINYNNLEIPLLIKYGFQANDEIAVLPFFGPVFSYAVSGKTKQLVYDKVGNGDYAVKQPQEYEKVGTFDEKKVRIGNGELGGMKRANMGLKLGCGVEYSNLYAELGYQFGITNVCKNDDYTARNNALFINVGVNF